MAGSSVAKDYWIGYVIGGGTTPAPHYAQSGWYVPTVTVPAGYSPDSHNSKYMSYIWVGLGGIGDASTHPLIQAGTEQNITASGSVNYNAWWELYTGADGGANVIDSKTLFPVKPGDQVGAVIDWVPGSNGATGSAGVGVCNWNTNTCFNISTSSNEPGNTAEWILEAPEVAGTAAPLPNFSTIQFFNGCWAYATTFSTNHKPNGTVNRYPLHAGYSPAQGGSSGVTGSITGTCQTINQGPQWGRYVLTNVPIMPGVNITPSTLGSNGSDFQINY